MDWLISRMPRPGEASSLSVDIGTAVVLAGLGALYQWSFAATGSTQLMVGGLAILLTGVAAAYSASVTPSPSLPIRAVALAALGLAVSVIVAPHPGLGSLVDAAVLLPLWVIVRSSFARRTQARVLQERTTRLARERDEHARAAVADERARIARELHDVVAHSMGVMVVQAQGAQRVMETDPASAREALNAIASTGREALDEMHRMVGLLRRPEEGAELMPQPGLSQLEALVKQERDAGLRLSFQVAGLVRPLPAGLDLAAYRIIQEALTNCRKYADGASAGLLVTYADRTLDIDVTNGVPVRAKRDGVVASGHGLVGMKERVTLYGGEFSAGPRTDGGYAVHASLPLDSPPS